MPKNRFIKNVAILGLSGIISKLFDFSFRAYYSQVLGTEGMGLLSLGFSLHSLMLTISTAGLGVAVSKTVSEYMELKNNRAVCRCMSTSLYSVSILSLLVTCVTFFSAPFLAKNVLGDARVSLSLCMLGPSVIFMGISYCLKGFFYAERRVMPPASSEILEQAVKFISIKALLYILAPKGVEYACAAVFLGITIGEFSSCTYLAVNYFFACKHYSNTKNITDCTDTKSILLRMLGISIPSLITSLCISGFRMQEEVLIVSAFERGGMAHSSAIAALGIVHGMAMPLLILPLTLLGSVMSLLVPEVSRVGIGNSSRLRHKVFKTYKYGICIGLFVCLIFILFGRDISNMFYGRDDASEVVATLAPLIPVMFIDSLSCSILNGLGKQMKLLFFTLMDFALRLTLIYFTIPLRGTSAFCFMVILSNVFTCILTFGSVLKIVRRTRH